MRGAIYLFFSVILNVAGAVSVVLGVYCGILALRMHDHRSLSVLLFFGGLSALLLIPARALGDLAEREGWGM